MLSPEERRGLPDKGSYEWAGSRTGSQRIEFSMTQIPTAEATLTEHLISVS